MQWGLGEVALGFGIALSASAIATLAMLSALGYKSNVTTKDLPLWLIAVLQVPLWSGLLGVPWFASKRRGAGTLRTDFGLAAGRSDLGWGIGMGVLLQVSVALVYSVVHVSECDLSGPARNLTDKANGVIGIPLLVLITVVGAPIVEEIFFRGLVLRSLTKRGLPGWAAIVISAIVFAGFHFEPAQFAGLTVVGLGLGFLAYRSGRLGAGMIAHATFNAVSVVALLRSHSCKS
jgi:membrane protease YdiL (CAAX protease family)